MTSEDHEQQQADAEREWSRSEPGWLEFRQQLSRLRRRAIARPLRVSLFTVLAVVMVVARQGLKRETFDASVTFRVAERSGSPDPEEGHYQTKARLREYVADGVLTKARCLGLIQRLGLYPKVLAVDYGSAIDAFREDITIKVFQNYFLKEDWQATGKPRSARVTIKFSYSDPQTALKVARSIGELVGQHEAEVRSDLAKVAANRARALSAAFRQRVDVLQRERAHKRLDLAGSAGQGHLDLELLSERVRKLKAAFEDNPESFVARQKLKDAQAQQRALRERLSAGGESIYVARLRVDLGRLNAEIAKLQLALERAGSNQTENELRAALERQQLLMRFEPVDWGRDPTPELSRRWRLSILGAVLFFALWPVIGIGVGAFDSRIHDLDDVRQLKLEPLGQVPPFPGDDLGALDDRRQTTQPRPLSAPEPEPGRHPSGQR